MEGAFPEIIEERQHVGLAAQGQRVLIAFAAGLFAVFAGIFKGVFQAAVNLESCCKRPICVATSWGVPFIITPPMPV